MERKSVVMGINNSDPSAEKKKDSNIEGVFLSLKNKTKKRRISLLPNILRHKNRPEVVSNVSASTTAAAIDRGCHPFSYPHSLLF